MKKSINLILIVFLFLLALAGLRVLWMKHVSPKINFGESEAGVMDLSSFESDKELYPLAGEWLYFPDALLTAEMVEKGSHKGQVKSYPQDWLDISDRKGFTYGTFYTKISLHDSMLNKSLSVHVPRARLASSLYINGKLLGSSGNPTSDLDGFEASMSPYIVHFFTEETTIEIILHVSTDGTTPPTPLTPIVLGTTDVVQENQIFSTMSKLVVITVFSFMLLFAGFLFVYLQARQRKAMLYLALLIVFSILTILVDYDQVLLLDLPVSYDVKSKIYRLSYVFNALFAFLFFKHFLPQFKTWKWFQAYPYINLFYSLYLIVAPLKLIDKYESFLVVILIVPFSYYIVKLIHALRSGATGAVLLFLVGIALLNNLLWSIYKVYANMLTFEYYPIDAIIAIILFILYWLRNYIYHTKEIELLTDELIKKDKEKDEFLAQTSHELRNPLHSMINIAQLIADNPKNMIAKEDQSNMNLLLSVGRRMSLLVDDLLDLSLMSEKRLRLVKEPVYMQTVVETVIEMTDYLIDSRKIIIKNNIPRNFPPVYADEGRVVQLTLNLIHNAIKYTDQGKIDISAQVVHNKAEIKIEDTGRGISTEHIDNIFEPFYKNDDVDGIGLGLQVTKELIELHGGTITVSSKLDQGTTVSFTLPLAEKSVVTTKSIAPMISQTSKQFVAAPLEMEDPNSIADTENTEVENKAPAKAKVLLVDDDQVNLEVIAQVLRADHYEVVTALSGKEALEKIQTSSYDLVVSDVMMQHMSGYALVREIRGLYGLSELPVILLTARGKMDDLKTGFQVGANDYVIKPVDASELKARVKALTDLQIAVKAQLRLEAAWLQAQINPHFLYNTINSIMMMAKTNPTHMQYLLKKFVYFLRTSYDFQNKQSLVSLQEELRLVDAYLTIEKERFGDRLQIVWGIDESLDVLIPPLSLQTLVENALKHGILNRVDGGKITLQSVACEKYVDLIVQDDGVGMSEQLIQKVQRHESIKGDGIGLINTDKRVRKWLQNPLIIESDLNKGTKITIRMNHRH